MIGASAADAGRRPDQVGARDRDREPARTVVDDRDRTRVVAPDDHGGERPVDGHDAVRPTREPSLVPTEQPADRRREPAADAALEEEVVDVVDEPPPAGVARDGRHAREVVGVPDIDASRRPGSGNHPRPGGSGRSSAASRRDR